MIDLPYSRVIEATVESDFFGFYSTDLEGFSGTLWNPERGPVVMEEGDYVAYFALTENISWWRGVFLSENPLEFTIRH